MLTHEQFLSVIEHDRWQDLVLSAGNIFFCFTLIPMLRHPSRPPLLTCIPTGLALLIGGFVFATLHLWLTALTQTGTGLQWRALAFKKSGGWAVARAAFQKLAAFGMRPQFAPSRAGAGCRLLDLQ